MQIKFGPAGLGPIKTATQTLNHYHQLGLKACEIAFTYSIYIKTKEQAEPIKKTAEKLNIQLSIHAPYFINLNSKEKAKIQASKQRILKCCEIGHYLGATHVVFHPGFYQKIDKETTYQNIKTAIQDMQKEIQSKGYKIKLAPEIMGKINVFGSPEEISRLSKETNCSFTIDFAHILAREKSIDYNKIKKLFPQKSWHAHFSGIEYGEKGEKHHIKTQTNAWKELLKNIPQDKSITIINESPDHINDSVKGLELSKK
jgi:deoxyribonuclease-4